MLQDLTLIATNYKIVAILIIVLPRMCLVGTNILVVAKSCAMLQQKSKSLHDKLLYCHEYLPLSRPSIFVVKC
jgi:hypothetical protein